MLITIHGIGDTRPDYNVKWRVSEILGVPRNKVRAFHYENLMDRSQISIWVKLAAKLTAGAYGGRFAGEGAEKVADYLADIFVFFLSPSVRRKITQELDEILTQYPEITLVGHSLGSMIAWLYCAQNPWMADRINLVTLGSPMGSPFMQNTLKMFLYNFAGTDKRPRVKSWVNVYSKMDPLSGDIDEMGCDQNIKINFAGSTRHREVDEYLIAYKLSLKG